MSSIGGLGSAEGEDQSMLGEEGWLGGGAGETLPYSTFISIVLELSEGPAPEVPAGCGGGGAILMRWGGKGA